MTELKLIKMSEIQPEPVEWLWEPLRRPYMHNRENPHKHRLLSHNKI